MLSTTEKIMKEENVGTVGGYLFFITELLQHMHTNLLWCYEG